MSETTKPRAWNSWLQGRSDRKEYWAYVAVVILVTVALSFIPGAPGNAGSTGVMLLIQIRRFHDMGRSGWWAVALLVAQFAVMLPIGLMMPSDTGLGIVALLGIAVIVAMGAAPGDPHENRFGPPRGKRALKDIFA